MIDTTIKFVLHMLQSLGQLISYLAECVFVTGLLAIVVAGAVSAYVYFKEM